MSGRWQRWAAVLVAVGASSVWTGTVATAAAPSTIAASSAFGSTSPVHVMATVAGARARATPRQPVGNVTYHGGPVMQATANSVPIFWFPPTVQDGAAADPAPSYATLIKRYFNDIGGSSLYQDATQYSQTVNGPVELIVNRSLEAVAVVDRHAYPSAAAGCAGNGVDCLDDSQIRAEVSAVASAHGLAGDTTNEFFVFLAPHESTCLDPTHCFKADNATAANFTLCAYHSFFTAGSDTYIYANMPYGALPETVDGNGCTTLTAFPNARDADIEIDAVSREQLDAVTDPHLDAWYHLDPTGEISDECASVYGAMTLDGGLANEQWNGHFYAVQEEWNNSISGCTKGAAVPPVVNDNYDPLTLVNGWTSASGTDVPAVKVSGDVVQLKGAIAGGNGDPEPFVLPPNARPATIVYVPIDLCAANKGRLYIQPDGVVLVQALVDPSYAQCFTSLDGASFALRGPQPLTPKNGWKDAPIDTSNASALVLNGVVHLKGAIATSGTNPVAFTVPAALRPTGQVVAPIDLCGGNIGQVRIAPDGTITVAALGHFSNAQCFTSLDGVVYPLSPTTPLTLVNGWTRAPKPSRRPAYTDLNGVVYLAGAMSTTGTNAGAFVLPPEIRPLANTYVAVTLCKGDKGRLWIHADGTTAVQALSSFANAQCMTSLDGVAYAPAKAFTSLTLVNGWTNAPLGTRNAAVDRLDGVVHFKGAIATSGSNAVPVVLPAAYAPTTTVYVPIDVCNADKGRLWIQPDGTVTVQTLGGFANAQCFTSLDGAEFVQATAAPLTLQNGWSGAPYGTGAPAATVADGQLYLSGGMSSGSGVAFTLPAGMRPAHDVFVPADLCNANVGRLWIHPDGTVTVDAVAGFANAQCFTSLDGTSFALTAGTDGVTLLNAWSSPASTRPVSLAHRNGLVYLQGALWTGNIPKLLRIAAVDRPTANVFVSVTLDGANKGRVDIDSTGGMTVETLSDPNHMYALTSLEGVTWAQ